MMAVLLQVLDTTIANVALPHMQASLSATQDTINWVLTSYIVASAIALPISGWLADRVGRKRLLLISVVAVHHRLGAVRDRDVAGRDGDVPRASGRRRRLHRAARPGDTVRHQPAREARPGDGAVRRRRDDRPDPRAGARRLADRQLQLALGVPGQPAGRHPVHPASCCASCPRRRRTSASSTCSASRCSRSRSGRLQFCLDRGEQNDWFSSWETIIEAGPRDRRGLDVRRPHDHGQASVVRPRHVHGPQFRDQPACSWP